MSRNSDFICLEQRSPTLLAPGTSFVEDIFFCRQGWSGNGSGSNASDGESWMKLSSLAGGSPPAVQSSSKQASDQYWFRDWGLGTFSLVSDLSIKSQVALMYSQG